MDKKQTKRQQVINLLQQLSVVRPKDLTERGLPKDYLYILAQEGVIERIGRGLYQWPEKDWGATSRWLRSAKERPMRLLLCFLRLIFIISRHKTLIRSGWRLTVKAGGPPLLTHRCDL